MSLRTEANIDERGLFNVHSSRKVEYLKLDSSYMVLLDLSV